MSCPTYCKGCIYRTNTKHPDSMCEFFLMTGNLRGCPLGKDCIRKTIGKHIPKSWNQMPSKPKRTKLTDEERREHRNALKRREYANKKAALSATNTENGTSQNILTAL